MSTVEVLRTINAFFSRHGGASLKLPSGWFGRPFDNLHQLTAVNEEDEAKPVIELDGSLRLTLLGPTSATIDGPILRLSGFNQGAWRWREYGTGVPHDEEFDGGTVEFAAHAALR